MKKLKLHEVNNLSKTTHLKSGVEAITLELIVLAFYYVLCSPLLYNGMIKYSLKHPHHRIVSNL